MRMPLSDLLCFEESPLQVSSRYGSLLAIFLDQASLQRTGQALSWLPSALWARECGHVQPLRRQFLNNTVDGAPRLETGVCRHTPLE